MNKTKLKDVFSPTGNTAVYLRHAESLADRMKKTILDGVESHFLRGKNGAHFDFPFMFTEFSYVGMDRDHYKKALTEKEAIFLMELPPRPEYPIDMVPLKFKCGEMMGVLHAYGHDERISFAILSALQLLGPKVQEDKTFVQKTIAEDALNHALWVMRHGRGQGPEGTDHRGKNNNGPIAMR